MTLDLPDAWRAPLADQLDQPYLAELDDFLVAEQAAGKRIFPPRADWLRALELTPPDTVRVVILGQDPYHGEGQAHGLCFSVRPGMKVPPSLVNIYKELKADLGVDPPAHGFLEAWARQGVLLLNNVLTVELGMAASHKGRGWERFTDAIVAYVNASAAPTVFMLWGSHAQKKAGRIAAHHLVLKSVHPSPLSAHRGFFGSRPFSRANGFLRAHGRGEINWALPAV